MEGNSNIRIHDVKEEDEKQTPAVNKKMKKSALEIKIENEREEMDKKYITQGIITSRIFNEKEKQEAYDKLKKESYEALKDNPVLILPSLKLKCLDKMPRVDILDTNMKFMKKNVNKTGRSTVLMIRKLLVDYVRDLADINIDHLENMNHTFSESPCTKAKRAIGMTDYTKRFLALADKSNNLAKEDKEGPERYQL